MKELTAAVMKNAATLLYKELEESMDHLYSTVDLARLIGVTEFRINYAHRAGKLPEPRVIAGKRIYTNEDVARVREYFNHHKPWQRKGDDA